MRVWGSVRRLGWRDWSAALLCVSVGVPGTPAAGVGRVGAKAAVVLTPWEAAEKGREALEGEPAGTRTRGEYERVFALYRAVYHEAPGDMHAAAAVNAVAELLAEEGRGGAGETGGASTSARSPAAVRNLKAAVGQYEFLRQQYPGSSLRVGALLAEAQIEQNDLGDTATARLKYKELLREYPRSSSAEEARAGLQSLDARDRPTGGDGLRATAPAGVDTGPVRSVGDGGSHGAPAGSGGTRDAAKETAGEASSSLPTMSPTGSGSGSGQVRGRPTFAPAPRDTGTAAAVTPASASGSAASGGVDGGKGPDPRGGPVPAVAAVRHSGAMAMVKGIRHWSTPNYTRVAIDLGDSVTYEAARVPNPDRIYFDLHGTRLAADLVGKSFGVTDDGYLKKIRAAQFSDDMTRVVLDVNDVTEYSAFLLPNPYRLIIDIHGGSKAGQQMAMMGAPAVAAKSAPTVPNTTAVKAPSSADVARLSEQPGKVEATSQPTSKPIAAVVARPGETPTDRKEDRQGVKSEQAAESGGLAGGVGEGAASIPAPRAGSGLTSSPTSSGRRGRRGKVTSAADARVVGDPGTPARAAVPTADGQTSLVRALGLKIGRIVIDAGHGGHDSGTLGVDGIEEKDVVLDVALRLGALLRQRLGADVIFTRSDDTFIPLETRTAIANKAQADLFLSIHANSSEDATARGVETYYLNFTTQVDALEVAARENAVSDQSIHQLSDLVKKIALKDKIEESREFAGDVEAGLYGGLQAGNAGLKNRGVKKAPFVVLIGANMPSVLAEISFVTNPRDASELRQGEYRQRVAESLYKGVAKYASGLSGTAPVATERAGGN